MVYESERLLLYFGLTNTCKPLSSVNMNDGKRLPSVVFFGMNVRYCLLSYTSFQMRETLCDFNDA